MKHTLPDLLVQNARLRPAADAIREKEYGIWQTVSWAEYLDHVRDFSLGLLELGFQAGDRLGIIGDGRPEWLYAELGAQVAGGIPAGIYQDSVASEVGYILNHCGASMVVAEDQEQVDKVLSLKADLPRLGKIIYHDPKGLRHYDDPMLIDFREVEALGRKKYGSEPDLFAKRVEALTEEDFAFVGYTSGTTGKPKGSLLKHGRIIRMIEQLQKADPKYPTDEYVSYLPLPWIVEQALCVYSPLYTGYRVNFPESTRTNMSDLREIAPHIVVAPPRVWEGICRQVMVKHLDAGILKKALYRVFAPVGIRWAEFKFSRKTPPFWLKVLYGISTLMLFRALRDRLGFPRVRTALTGGASLGPEVFKFFHGMGVNLKQIYGQTEATGITTIHRDDEINSDTVGRPIPGVEMQISPDGEILTKSPYLFEGYLGDAKATDETIVGGWLHSGDAGYFTEDQQLIVIDRVKDLQSMSTGHRFSPMFIENMLKFCPYIIDGIVVGEGRPWTAAIICIDFNNTGKWAEDHRLGYTTYADLASKPEICDLVEREVVRVNRSLPIETRLKRFLLLYKELDPDDEELTRTRKLRRGFVHQKFAREIEALYGDEPSVFIESAIRYQDGRTTKIKADLEIRRVREALPEEKKRGLLSIFRKH